MKWPVSAVKHWYRLMLMVNGVWRLIFTFLGFCHVYTSNICINMNQNQTEVHSTDHIFHQLLFYQNIYSSPSLRWIVLITIIYQVPIAFTYLIFSNFIFHVGIIYVGKRMYVDEHVLQTSIFRTICASAFE